MRVVYGHTDSIYVQMPIEQTEATLALLNNHVREKFPNLLKLDQHPVTLEFEKYYQTLGVGLTKNRNAGLISWKDGKYLDTPEFVMTGFAAKRQSITKLAKETQLSILKMWVGGYTESDITNMLRAAYSQVLNGNMELEYLINRSRFRSERFTYKCKECNKTYTWKKACELHSDNFCVKCGQDIELVTLEGKKPSIGSGVEGVLWNNQNEEIQIDDSYVFIRVADEVTRATYLNPVTGKRKRPSYISATIVEKLEEHTPDWPHYAESILKKAEPIYKAMGWNLDPIKRDSNQKTLDEWW
jgi:DNA polymerase elongation subunit (family B)